MAQQLLDELLRGSKNVMTRKRIINFYMNNRSSTIPELSKELNLSIPTVAKIIAEMYDDGYVMNYGKMETNKGRSPTLYGLTPNSRWSRHKEV